jgi:glutamate N-acetyltransferase/amino-acid N-acetyltransferase
VTDVQASIEAVQGFRVAGVHAGLKANGQLDFALVVSDRPCAAAGVFTTNLVKAAPVLVDMQTLENDSSKIRAIVVNTRCANACTGRKGVQDAHITQNWVAEAVGVRQEQVLVMSTGVIGTHLPMDHIRSGVTLATNALGNDWATTAAAIMTTDTRPKTAYVEVTTPTGQTYHIGGMVKGSGMIAPNMATMLGVICTDAALSPEIAQDLLRKATRKSFNCIVVDGDMSTNDTVVLLANGASGAAVESDETVEQFEQALQAVARSLAQQVVRDGEGVTKFVTVNVVGASSDEDANKIANAIATSPLVKTAFYGGDANWGRIVAAAGRSGVAVDPDKMKLWIAQGETSNRAAFHLQLFDQGIAARYDETDATAIMHESSVSVLLDCGDGDGEATLWTCDLSHDYVSINGHYRS